MTAFGKAPAQRHLRREHRVAQRLPVGGGHQRRDRQIAQALTRREQHLAVAVRDERPRVEGRRADEAAPVEAQAPIGLVRQQEDAVADPLRGAFEQVGERGQDLAPVDPAGRIVRRVDDDQPRPRSDRRVDRVEVEIEARLFSGTFRGTASAASSIGS